MLSNYVNVLADSAGQPYQILLPLALILLISKSLMILCRRAKLPQIVGALITGVLVGLILLIPNQTILTPYVQEGIDDLAKIGVILIMFSAGVETDVNKIKSCGLASIVITILGVVVPMGLGFLTAFAFFPNNNWISNLFYGVVLTATSVSVTVSALKELGKIDSKVGTSIVSAAIIDDVIGVILLSLLVSLGESSGGSAVDVMEQIGLMVLYFILALGLGFLIKKVFTWLDVKYPMHRRIAIYGLAICFFYAYFAERFFGVADITGAYIAGLVLSGARQVRDNPTSTQYIDRKVEQESYLLFQPVFFASIGLMLFDKNEQGNFIISEIFTDWRFLLFGLCFVIAGMVGKVVGAGIGAKICKYSFGDSLKVGVGMMCRAEVVIVCAERGISAGMINPGIMPFVLVLIVVTSFITPIILKALYKKETVTADLK